MKLFTKHTANGRLYQLLLIMKMSFVLTCLFLQVHAGVYSQKRISVQADKLPVSQVLAMIELKTSYRFFYNSDELRKLPPVTLNVSNGTLPDIMRQLLADGMRYRVMDDRLVVLGNDIDKSQFKRVKGRLTDNKGGPFRAPPSSSKARPRA